MKKVSALLLVICLCMMCLVGCTKSDTTDETTDAANAATDAANAATDVSNVNTDGETLVIKEKMFITQINDIYINPNEYNGKTVNLVGMYDSGEYEGVHYDGIIRRGPGCCGNDGVAGFEFVWDGELPEIGTWIEVTGKIEVTTEGEYQVVKLILSELKVGVEPQSEYVVN